MVSGNYTQMNWEMLQQHDEAVQQYIAAGDYRLALDTLVRSYQHIMVGFCANLLEDVDHAEEIAQEVFLAAYVGMPRFRHQASIRTWLFSIARKQCLKALRNRRRRSRLDATRRHEIAATAHRHPTVPPDADPEAYIAAMKRCLANLGAADRTLLVMRYDTGLGIADMAHILGVSMASVRRRLAAALRRLRESLNA